MGPFIENNPGFVLALAAALIGVGIWLGSMQTNISTLKGAIDEIRTDIKKIFERLPASTVAGDSPLQLTDLGKKVSEEIQASDWAKKVAPAVLVRVANKHPYEVQEFCLEYVNGEDVLSEEMQQKVKTSAYGNGIAKEQVLRVLAVELRDQLLPEQRQV